MEFTLLLVLAALMGTAYSGPICKYPCLPATKLTLLEFQHVLDLQHSSCAPWTIEKNSTDGREPRVIKHAVCKNSTVKGMVAEPIFLRIPVYKMVRNNSDYHWCKCPYDLAVGCTCVHQQQQQQQQQ